jgi:hypothetical protein
LHGAHGAVAQSAEKEHSDAALLLIVQLGSGSASLARALHRRAKDAVA